MQNGAEEEYEEILEQCATLTRACEQAREYSPWFGDDWSILVRRSDKLSGKEFLHSSQQSFEH
jgi:hypothetical protein